MNLSSQESPVGNSIEFGRRLEHDQLKNYFDHEHKIKYSQEKSLSHYQLENQNTTASASHIGPSNLGKYDDRELDRALYGHY